MTQNNSVGAVTHKGYSHKDNGDTSLVNGYKMLVPSRSSFRIIPTLNELLTLKGICTFEGISIFPNNSFLKASTRTA